MPLKISSNIHARDPLTWIRIVAAISWRRRERITSLATPSTGGRWTSLSDNAVPWPSTTNPWWMMSLRVSWAANAAKGIRSSQSATMCDRSGRRYAGCLARFGGPGTSALLRLSGSFLFPSGISCELMGVLGPWVKRNESNWITSFTWKEKKRMFHFVLLNHQEIIKSLREPSNTLKYILDNSPAVSSVGVSSICVGLMTTKWQTKSISWLRTVGRRDKRQSFIQGDGKVLQSIFTTPLSDPETQLSNDRFEAGFVTV